MDIQRKLNSYALEQTDDNLWELIRTAIRTNNLELVESAFALRLNSDTKTLETAETVDLEPGTDWHPRYDRVVHARRLIQIGGILDEQLGLYLDGREQRLDQMRAVVEARPRLGRPGLETWAMAAVASGELSYGHFQPDFVFREDFDALIGAVKQLPKKCNLRKVAAAHKLVNSSYRRRQRRVKKSNQIYTCSYEAVSDCMFILRQVGEWIPKFLINHVALNTLEQLNTTDEIDIFDEEMRHFEISSHMIDTILRAVSPKYTENTPEPRVFRPRSTRRRRR